MAVHSDIQILMPFVGEVFEELICLACCFSRLLFAIWMQIGYQRLCDIFDCSLFIFYI